MLSAPWVRGAVSFWCFVLVFWVLCRFYVAVLTREVTFFFECSYSARCRCRALSVKQEEISWERLVRQIVNENALIFAPINSLFSALEACHEFTHTPHAVPNNNTCIHTCYRHTCIHIFDTKSQTHTCVSVDMQGGRIMRKEKNESAGDCLHVASPPPTPDQIKRYRRSQFGPGQRQIHYGTVSSCVCLCVLAMNICSNLTTVHAQSAKR